MKKIILTILLGLFLIGLVSSATYYVSPTGNDITGDGSEGNPWQRINETLNNGINELLDGDDLILLDGTYVEQIDGQAFLYGDRSITITGQNKGGATVNCTTCTSYTFYFKDGTVALNDFNIDCATNPSSMGIYFRGSFQNAHVSGMNIKNCRNGIQLGNTDGNITNGSIKNSFINLSSTLGASIHIDEGNSNIVIQNNTFENYAKYDFESGTYNISTKENIFSGEELIVSGNGGINEYFNDTIIEFENILRLLNLNFQETYIIENKTFAGDLISSNEASVIYLDNITNIIFNNINIGNISSLMNFNNSIINFFYADSDSHNITFKNSNIFVQNISAMRGYGNNVLIDNNTVYVNHSTGIGAGIDIYGDDTTISNNFIYAYNNEMNHLLGCGSEVMPARGYRYENCLIENNIIYANYDSVGTNVHTLYMGYTNYSMANNNTVYGGGYAHAIKGNANLLVNGSKLYGVPTINISIYQKAGENITFSNIYIEGDSSTRPIYIDINPTDSYNVNDSNWINIEVNCSSACIGYIGSQVNGTIYFKDVIGTSMNAFTNYTAKLYVYYSITATLNPLDLILSLTDNLLNEYTYDSDITNYFLSVFYNSTGNITYSPYTYTASKSGHITETGGFSLLEPRILNINLESSCSTLTTVALNMTIGFFALAILGLSLILVLKRNPEGGLTSEDLKSLMIIFVVVIIGSIFARIIAESVLNTCP